MRPLLNMSLVQAHQYKDNLGGEDLVVTKRNIAQS